MSYDSMTIAEALKNVNRSYFLPDMQRPFVWSSDQIIALFDSLMKGYPISTFLFWNVTQETKQQLRLYRFHENYRKDKENDLAEVNEASVTIVLDGQQRFNALMIGLRGTYAKKTKHARRGKETSWSSQTLFLDLFKDPNDEHENDTTDFGVTYGFKFDSVPQKNDYNHHWLPVGLILNCPIEKLELLVEKVMSELHLRTAEPQKELAAIALRRLHEVCWSEKAVNFYTVGDRPLPHVLEIFIRANDGGTSLKKSDLFMSTLIARWSTKHAREEITYFVDYINRKLPKENTIDRDFILKACLVLADLDVRFNVTNLVAGGAIEKIEVQWDTYKSSIERTFRLINKLGISGNRLTSKNAVLPIVYYLHGTSQCDLLGASDLERKNVRRIHRWLLQSLLVGAFSGSSDRTISLARTTIREGKTGENSFPEEHLYAALNTGGRNSRLGGNQIEEFLDLTVNDPRTPLVLSLLYDDVDWINADFIIDHILPLASVDEKHLRRFNVSEPEIKSIRGAVDRLPNLQLLWPDEHRAKISSVFDDWIRGRDQNFLERHSIPDTRQFWTTGELPNFVEARRELLRIKLRRISGIE